MQLLNYTLNQRHSVFEVMAWISFYIPYKSRCVITYPCPGLLRIIYVHVWQTVSALTRGLFWCLFPKLRSNKGNKHQNNTWVSTETVRHERSYITLFLTGHNESIYDDEKQQPLLIFPVSHWLGFHFTDYVTIDCWWRHNHHTIVKWSLE